MMGSMKLMFVFIVVFDVAYGNYQVPSTCQPITIPLCKSLPYNMTRLPNLLNHYTQESVTASIDNVEIRTLVRTNCSDALVFVLCVYHLPICTTGFDVPIPPCRSLCQKVKNDCLPTLQRFGRKWPSEYVNCNDMPTYEKGVCIKPESFMHKDQCKCDKDTSMNLKKFRARGFHFVVIAQVNKIIKTANQRKILLTNKKIIKKGLVRVPKRKLVMYTNSSCPCPALQTNQTYLMMGHEDMSTARLLLTPQSYIYVWPRNWRKEKYKQIRRTLRPLSLRILLRTLEQTHKRKMKKKHITKNKRKASGKT